MEIYNPRGCPLNIPQKLKPLFEAMEAGKRIKSVTCIDGIINKDNPSKDFLIENFIALTYYVRVLDSDEILSQDYVVIDSTKRKDFWMSWVKSFELYE